jgi:hypothetical protein
MASRIASTVEGGFVERDGSVGFRPSACVAARPVYKHATSRGYM